MLFKIKLVNMSRAKKKAFTLVEVLISAVILSIGLVVIFEVFLTSLEVVNLFNNRLNAQCFLNEKIWQLQSDLDQQRGIFIPMQQSGVVIIQNREFNWQLNMESVNLLTDLYKVTGQMLWSEGKKQRIIKRQAMVKSYFSNADPGKENNK